MKRSNSCRRLWKNIEPRCNSLPTWYVIYVKLAQLLEQLNQNAEAAQELETLFYVSNYAVAIASTEWFANADTLRGPKSCVYEMKRAATVQFTPAGQYMLVTALVNQQVPAQEITRTTSKLHYFIG